MYVYKSRMSVQHVSVLRCMWLALLHSLVAFLILHEQDRCNIYIVQYEIQKKDLDIHRIYKGRIVSRRGGGLDL